MNVFISPFQNPFINLALEDYFLRESDALPVLFFYINRPSVIMGRFQNPWLETNLPYLVKNDIWLVRRQSGGGCVYHDEGNLNFSFIVKGGVIDRIKHAEILQRAFLKADIKLQISPRNDLWLQDVNDEWKKISGSAYKQTKFASFHHGTFLISSDLQMLNECLKATVIPKSTKSIASVRSKVMSLQERYEHIDIQDVIDLISFELNSIPIGLDGSILSLPEVQASFHLLSDHQWIFGETPAFELESKNGKLAIRKGIMEESQLEFNSKNTENHFDSEMLQKLFPDFSEQHRSSNQIL